MHGWINEKVRSPTAISHSNIDTCFKTGYLLGELLIALNLSVDKHAFVKSSTSQAIVQNFVAIETIVREQLGLRIPVAKAIDVIDGKQGAAIALVYEIKSCWEAVSNGTSYAGKKLKINTHSRSCALFDERFRKEGFYRARHSTLSSNSKN